MVAKFRILCVDDETHILNVVRRQILRMKIMRFLQQIQRRKG